MPKGVESNSSALLSTLLDGGSWTAPMLHGSVVRALFVAMGRSSIPKTLQVWSGVARGTDRNFQMAE